MIAFDSSDWKTRWNFLDDFIRELVAPDYSRMPAETEIRNAETKLSRRLSPSIREWCAFAVASDQIKNSFSFRDCFVIEPVPGHSSIGLLLQGEGDVYWAVEEDSWSQDDPPVQTYYLVPRDASLCRGMSENGRDVF